MDKKRISSYIDLLIVTAIWGIAGPVIKYTLPSYPPMVFLAYRFLLSILFFLPVFLFRKFSLPFGSKRGMVFLTSAALLGSTLNLGLLFFGYEYTSVLDASILTSISPLMVIAASAYFLKENITKKEKIGLFVTLLGTLIIVIEPAVDHSLFALDNIIGNLIIIAANVAWVAYVILTKIELKYKVDPLSMTFYMFLIGFVSVLPFAVIRSGGLTNLVSQVVNQPTLSHMGVWYMALLSGNLAYFLYQKGQKNIEASEATLFSYLTPLFSTPLAVFWLKEDIKLSFIIGAFVVAIGVFIAEYKVQRQTKIKSK